MPMIVGNREKLNFYNPQSWPWLVTAFFFLTKVARAAFTPGVSNKLPGFEMLSLLVHLLLELIMARK